MGRVRVMKRCAENLQGFLMIFDVHWTKLEGIFKEEIEPMAIGLIYWGSFRGEIRR
jgi:hypothetical protein